MFLLVPAYPGSPGQKAVKRLCVCACACVCVVKYEGNFYVAAHTCTVSGVLLMNWSWETDVFLLR